MPHPPKPTPPPSGSEQSEPGIPLEEWRGKRAEHRHLKTGAIPTPRHKLAAATPFQPRPGLRARPISVPPVLEMWLNNQYGDCVTAEEAASIAMWSVACGLDEIHITDQAVMDFCRKFNLLNGAMLDEVMDHMAKVGLMGPDGKTAYKDGPYKSVDYSNEPLLQAAIDAGPIKIGIDSSALPSGAGGKNGWHGSGGHPEQYRNEDHCVALWNHGSSSDLFAALGVPVPSGFPSTGYHLYTWSTIGVVDHDWIMSTCGEAWLRDPTDTVFGPSPAPTPTPTPVPPPGPTPTPPPGPGPGPTTPCALLEAWIGQAILAHQSNPVLVFSLQLLLMGVASLCGSGQSSGGQQAPGPIQLLREVARSLGRLDGGS